MVSDDRTAAPFRDLPPTGEPPVGSGASDRPAGEAGPAGSGRSYHRPVRTYDFRRPDKLSKDHLRSLEAVHETFARLAASTLSSYLRMVINVQLVEVVQVTFGEYLDALPQPTTVHLVTLDPLPGRMMLEIDVPLAQSLIDRVMGGTGKPLRRQRATTEIEVILLKALVTSLLSAYQDSWLPVESLKPILGDAVFNPEVLQSVALPGDSAALVRLEVRVSGITHSMTLCLPYITLEHVLPKLSRESPHRHGQDSSLQGWLTEQLVFDVDVPLVAILGRARLPVRDLLSLEAGQVVLLETRADQPVELQVGDSSLFRGAPGLVGRHLAVRIGEVMAKEFDDGEQGARARGI